MDTTEGITLDSRKVANVLEWPSPRHGKDIQRFLGIVNYFRDHIPNVSRLTAPLDALRHAGSLNNTWNKHHEDAFYKIKYAVSHAPTLRHVDLRLPFHLATDASNDGTGAVLYQKYNDHNNIVGFMARALSKSERNYSVTKRELLAVVFALKKFHKYLWGNPFTLYMDHKALVYLNTQKDPNPMMIHWLGTLLDYTFTVVYLPGISNILPDHLSRLFSPPSRTLAGGKTYHSKTTNHNEDNMIMRATHLDDMMQPPEEERHTIPDFPKDVEHEDNDFVVKVIAFVGDDYLFVANDK